MYDAIFSRSFSKNEKRKLGVWTFFSCFIIGFTFCALVKSYYHGPMPAALNIQFSRGIAFKMLSISEQKTRVSKEESFFLRVCNFSNPKSDYCELKDGGEIRISGNTSTIFIPSSSRLNDSLRIKPHARKSDGFVMSRVREFSLNRTSQPIPECTKNHTVPAIVFSAGGYAGNLFHDFSDIIVPLYITSRRFRRQVQFVVSNALPWWLGKYRILLSALSEYEIIEVEKQQEYEIDCFPSMTVGLRAHSEFGFDTSRPDPDGNFSMPIFTRFLRKVYSLQRDTVPDPKARKPRLYMMARMKTRTIVNLDEVVAAARGVGFDVEVYEAGGNVEIFSKVVNSFDVMVAVHGAGVTNSLFLPEGGVLVQIVPLGLDWLAEHDYAMPARAMNLRYLEYKIGVNESSLIEQYPVDHPVIRDPDLYNKQGWAVFRKIYLDAQNVRLDISRFRTTLLKALELLRDQ